MQTNLPLTHPLINRGVDDRAGDVAARYLRPRQREYAMLLCSRHPNAADYLAQAPVLLLAVASHARSRNNPATQEPKPDTPALSGGALDHPLDEWRKLVEMGWKLPKVMAHYGVAPQFRALKAGACISMAWWPITLMSRQMKGSALAQAIPGTVTAQRDWIKAQLAWYRIMLQRGRWEGDGLDNPLAYTRWAAVAFGRASAKHSSSSTAARAAGDIADFAVANIFNTGWSLVQAAEATALWHTNLAREHETMLSANDSIVTDYAPFPDVFLAPGGLRIEALNSRAKLRAEGIEMKHCVVDYHAEVALGVSRIFSIRDAAGMSICTFELSRYGAAMRGRGLDQSSAKDWRLNQAQGRREHYSQPQPRAPSEAMVALAEFCDRYAPDWRKSRSNIEHVDLTVVGNDPVDPTLTVDLRALQQDPRYRLGPDGDVPDGTLP